MRSFGKNSVSDTEVFSIFSTSLSRALAELSPPTKFFIALVLCDSDQLSVAEISGFSKSLLEKGAIFICTWGKGCERFHDIIDETWLEMDALGKSYLPKHDGTLMTTWHEDDSLSEALWFSLACAWPLDVEFDSCSTIILTIGNQSWENEVNSHLKNIEKFVEEISNED